MADTVQELLEDMVPELEDLARKRIFSQPEIKEIVRRRRDFEYKLKRRESQKSEYLRYVQYERTLDKLRGKRIFAMAPIHHHYELKGWPESRVVIRFWIIGILLALFSLTTFKIR